ncbi:flagellar protein FliT [Bacillus gobiensis]|uniref:flagellar protein FliT n=1 Tax=Bacillus gobiensis TaxID=1441095 RepID=UPI003D1B64C3
MGSTATLFKETKSFMEMLEGEKDRDLQIQAIEEFLDMREELIYDLKPPLSQNEQQQMQQLLEWNSDLLIQFTSLKKSIMKDIGQAKLKRATTNRYITPYAQSQIDGRYYDKRK